MFRVGLLAAITLIVACSSDSDLVVPLDGADQDQADVYGSMYFDQQPSPEPAEFTLPADGNIPPIDPPPTINDKQSELAATPTAVPTPKPTTTVIPSSRSDVEAVPTPRGLIAPTPTPVVHIAIDPYDDGPGAFFPVAAAPISFITDDRVFSCSIDGEVDTFEQVQTTVALAASNGETLRTLVGSAGEASSLLATPDTRAISIDFDPDLYSAVVTGSAGSVPPLANLLVGNIELNDFVVLTADETGAFSTDIAGVEGTHVLVKQDTTGNFINPERAALDENLIAPGVLIQIPVIPASDGIAFSAGAKPCCGADAIAPFTVTGVLETDHIEPGGQARVSGTVTVFTAAANRPANEQFQLQMTLLGDANGRQVGRAGKFVSPFLTPTGLPIERTLGSTPIGRFLVGAQEISFEFNGRHWVATFEMDISVPELTREGTYSLVAGNLWNVTDAALPPVYGLRPSDVFNRDPNQYRPNLTTVVVGDPNPMRLTTTLLADQVDDGARGGLVAREDFGLFDIGGRSSTRHEAAIPRLDPYGTPWSYQLDPFAPMLDVVDRALPGAPALNPDFSASALKVTVERPDGSIDVLGPAPLTRYGVKSPRTAWDQPLGLGGGELREIPQLMGDGDTFAYSFPTDGDYVVTLNGKVSDANGNVHGICGTYDVTVANHLEIETSMLPTTPFEVGNSIAPTVTILPGVPAEIVYTVTHVAADKEVVQQTFSGTANNYGWWDGNGETFTFDRDGEYRVDVDTRYTADDGRIWVGRTRFGGVVATPNAPFAVHGRRGPDGESDLARPWAFEDSFDSEDDAHWQFPYFTGDVLWGDSEPGPGQAVITRMSIQSFDDDNDLIERAREVTEKLGSGGDLSLELALRAGQMPLTLGPENTGLPGTHPDEISLWSYVYGSAERPGVRVRETIQGDDINGAYWRFDDAYHGQLGNGPDGDLAGEFKFLYGGAVIRDAVEDEGIYAIYGASWIHTVEGDPLGSRLFPPFQGAGGGPNGGPLFTTHGREIDIFMVPMAVRPGAVLETGDTFRMAVPIMPTLPSLVDYTVIAPDGSRRQLGGRANAVGYFYDPDDDFVVDQAGLWTVELTVTHDGQTSAGVVLAPFPTGGPLTPDGFSFSFVVVDGATHDVKWATDLFSLQPGEWFADRDRAIFATLLPDGWAGDSARLIVTMPGNVLIDQQVNVKNGLVVWELNGEELNQIATNFDTGGGLYDTLTITLFADGEIAGTPSTAVAAMMTHGARTPEIPPNPDREP
ncbi:MAG: hypothetical protein HOF43_07805 [Chloroflexi bacterium]|nr:hypothetical protein [Chloroflexota bacterium]